MPLRRKSHILLYGYPPSSWCRCATATVPSYLTGRSLYSGQDYPCIAAVVWESRRPSQKRPVCLLLITVRLPASQIALLADERLKGWIICRFRFGGRILHCRCRYQSRVLCREPDVLQNGVLCVSDLYDSQQLFTCQVSNTFGSVSICNFTNIAR